MSGFDNQNYNVYSEGFRTLLNLAPQNSVNRLLGTTQYDLHYAEEGDYFNQDFLAPSTPQRSTSDHAPTPDKETSSMRRVGIFSGFEDSAWIKKSDDVRMATTDPTSKYMISLSNGKERYHETEILNAYDGPAYEYKVDRSGALISRAPVQINWNTAQDVAVDLAVKHEAETIQASGNQNITLGKIARTKTMLMKANLGPGKLYFVIDAEGIEKLQLKIPASSSDYVAAKTIQETGMGMLFGFMFVMIDQCNESAPGVRKYFGMHESAMQFAARDIVTARVSERADRKYRAQAYYEAEHGAARMIDKAIVRVFADLSR